MGLMYHRYTLRHFLKFIYLQNLLSTAFPNEPVPPEINKVLFIVDDQIDYFLLRETSMF